MTELYKRGERVKHTVKTDWGLGEVLEDQVGDRVQVIFEDADLKSFAVSVAPFIRVTGEECKSEYLTALVKRHLRKDRKMGATQLSAVLSFDGAVHKFLKSFPTGFHDKKYLDNERDYKVKAHERLLTLLGREQMETLMSSHHYDEIWNRARTVVNETNLISPYEKLWLKNGVDSPGRQQLFSTAVSTLLWSEAPMAERFESFARMLYDIGAAKWPIATYLLFLAFPDTQIFLKPEVTKLVAKIFRKDIRYVPTVNWTTYAEVLNLAEDIKTRLIQLGHENLIPKDMIDVQSFIWVVGAYDD